MFKNYIKICNYGFQILKRSDRIYNNIIGLKLNYAIKNDLKWNVHRFNYNLILSQHFSTRRRRGGSRKRNIYETNLDKFLKQEDSDGEEGYPNREDEYIYDEDKSSPEHIMSLLNSPLRSKI